MPPHHYSDWWYDELPDEAKKAATAIGYATKEDWDTDHEVPYDTKSFAELTMTERRAAMYLGFKPIEKKLDPLWWSETSEETKAAALAVGWTQETWDDDWRIQDLPIEHKYWNELTEKEKAGAIYFGYTRITWDETEEQIFEDDNTELTAMALPTDIDEAEEEIAVEAEANNNDEQAENELTDENAEALPTIKFPAEAEDEIVAKVEADDNDEEAGKEPTDECAEVLPIITLTANVKEMEEEIVVEAAADDNDAQARNKLNDMHTETLPTMTLTAKADKAEEEIVEAEAENDEQAGNEPADEHAGALPTIILPAEGNETEEEIVVETEAEENDEHAKAPEEKRTRIHYADTETFESHDDGVAFDDHDHKQSCNIT